jgi:hypothetical protein
MNNFKKILLEMSIGSKRERITKAIKNRFLVSFYYNGPKGEVLPGRRIKAELVALGLTKKGNLVARGWVQPPSISKRGYEKHGWRLFMLNRMSGIQIYEDETFDVKRPDLNDSGDKSLSVVYVTSDWGTLPTVPKKDDEKPEPTTEPELPEPKPSVEPEIEPEPDTEPEPTIEPELPEPKPESKPPITPDPKIDFTSEIYDELKKKVQDVDGKKTISPDDFNVLMNNLRKKEFNDWSNRKKEIGDNSKPGEGTRRRIEKETEIKLFNLMKKDNIVIGTIPLQESIKRIKALIFF